MSDRRLADLEEALREALPVDSVESLEEFPFKEYSEFIDALNAGSVEVLTGEDPEAFGVLASSAEKAVYRILEWSTLLVAGGCAVGWWRFGNTSLLLGVPLAFIGGWAFSIPAFMRSKGLWLNRGLMVLVIYLLYSGATIAALLVCSYLVPNVLNHWLRQHCRQVFLRAVAESELVLVWLFLRGRIVPLVNEPPTSTTHPESSNAELLWEETGTISRLLIDEGHGFIQDEQGDPVWFHRSSVRGAVFDLLREGQHVQFTRDVSAIAPRAGIVRLTD